jgi:hypothetical protein
MAEIAETSPANVLWSLVAIPTAAATAATAAAVVTAAAAAAATAAATAIATATAAAASVATAATTAAAAIFTRTGFVDGQVPATKFGFMQAIDGRLRFRIRAHFHETEAFAASRITIHHHLGALDLTILGEQLLQTRTINLETQVSTVQFPSHYKLQTIREEFGFRLLLSKPNRKGLTWQSARRLRRTWNLNNQKTAKPTRSELLSVLFARRPPGPGSPR